MCHGEKPIKVRPPCSSIGVRVRKHILRVVWKHSSGGKISLTLQITGLFPTNCSLLSQRQRILLYLQSNLLLSFCWKGANQTYLQQVLIYWLTFIRARSNVYDRLAFLQSYYWDTQKTNTTSSLYHTWNHYFLDVSSKILNEGIFHHGIHYLASPKRHGTF